MSLRVDCVGTLSQVLDAASRSSTSSEHAVTEGSKNFIDPGPLEAECVDGATGLLEVDSAQYAADRDESVGEWHIHAHFAADRSPGDQPERDVFSEVAMGERIRFRKGLPAIALNDSVDERPLGDSVGIGEELLEPCGIRVQSRGQRKPLLIESIDDLGDPGCDRSVITMS